MKTVSNIRHIDLKKKQKNISEIAFAINVSPKNIFVKFLKTINLKSRETCMHRENLDQYMSIIGYSRRPLKIYLYQGISSCLSVRYRMAFLTVNLQDIAKISQAARANHAHSLSMYICLCYEYGCQSLKDHHNRTHSLVLCCTCASASSAYHPWLIFCLCRETKALQIPPWAPEWLYRTSNYANYLFAWLIGPIRISRGRKWFLARCETLISHKRTFISVQI